MRVDLHGRNFPAQRGLASLALSKGLRKQGGLLRRRLVLMIILAIGAVPWASNHSAQALVHLLVVKKKQCTVLLNTLLNGFYGFCGNEYCVKHTGTNTNHSSRAQRLLPHLSVAALLLQLHFKLKNGCPELLCLPLHHSRYAMSRWT